MTPNPDLRQILAHTGIFPKATRSMPMVVNGKAGAHPLPPRLRVAHEGVAAPDPRDVLSDS